MAILFSESLVGQVADKNFKVVVTDSGTAAPLPFATVCWQSILDKASGNGVANANGEVMIKSQGGRVVVSVSCLGYRPLRDTVVLSSPMVLSLSEDIFNLEQVTVTGTRTPRTIKESAVLTQLITQKDIRVTSAATITDVLAMEIPSIEVGQAGYGQTISSQGMEGKYTLVLVDGERMAGETDGNVDFSRINAANIEQVEIVRGASSALYGSNAMGGVINIITKKPAQPLEVSAGFRYVQPNQRNATRNRVKAYDEAYRRDFYRNQDWQNINGDLSLGYRRNNFYTNTYFGFKSFDGYVLSSRKAEERNFPEQDSTALVRLADYACNSFVDYTVTNKTGFTGKRLSGEAHASYYRHEEFDFSDDGLHNLYRDYTIGGFAERKLGDSSLVRLSYNRDAYDKFDVREQADVQRLKYRQAYNHAKTLFSSRFGKRHFVLGGAEFLYEQLECTKFRQDESFAAKGISDAVILLQDEVSLAKGVALTAGVRGGYNSSFGEHISPSLALKYAYGDFSYRASYARGFRTPSLKELYMSWNHMGAFLLQGNEDLKAETSNFTSLSVDYTNTSAKLSATAIASYNEVFDKIDLERNSDGSIYRYVNIDHASVWSAELLLKWRPVSAVMLKSGYVYTKIPDLGTGAQQFTAAPHALLAQLEYSFKRERYELTANLSGKVTGSKEEHSVDDDSKPYTVLYPTYSLWDFTLSQQLGGHFSLTTGVKNLFDYTAPIVTFSSTSTVGRRFFVAVGYKF